MGRLYTDAIPVEQYAARTCLITSRCGYHRRTYVCNHHIVRYIGRFGYLHRLVVEIPLSDFVDGLPLALGQPSRDATGGKWVIRRARSRLGGLPYDVVPNNCERFRNWCQAREPRREPTDSLKWPLRLAVFTFEGVVSEITAATWPAGSTETAFLYEGGIEQRWKKYLCESSRIQNSRGSAAVESTASCASRWSAGKRLTCLRSAS